MRNLLYKEFKLSIHVFFLLMPILTGALFLIPQWVFLVALMYFFFVTVPNVYNTYNSQNDLGFTLMMPVRKCDIVKAKIGSVAILELMHIVVGAVFAVANILIYRTGNFVLDLNLAFFGTAFMMFGIFNLFFFPRYFRTAYFYGIPLFIAMMAAIVFAAAVELLVIFSPVFAALMEGAESTQRLFQLVWLLGGIGVFAVTNYAAYKLSAARFDKIDL